MKKIIVLSLCIAIAFASTACGDKKETSSSSNTDTKKEEVKKDFSGKHSEKGKGKIFIVTPSGSSKNGKTPFIYVDENTAVTQISLEAIGIDGSKLSYIYIDGMENKKDQIGDYQGTLSLEGDALKKGKHKVELVQYDNDKPKGKIITYKSSMYEVKEK